VSLAWTRWNPGHQAGAIAPLLVAAREAWLGGYEWVVRANPDVLFLDPAPLAARMADARSSLVAWVCRLPNQYPKWSSIPTEYFLNTDVLAARVDAINHSGWRGGRSSRPEFFRDFAEARTTLALDAATRSGGATLWTAGSRPSLCRAQSHGVFHSHQACRRSVQPSDPSATARAIEAAAACYAARYEDARALACGAGGCDGKAAALHRHYRSRGQSEGRFFGCGQTPVEALAILHEEMRDAAAACYAARYADVRALVCGSGDCDGKSDALHRHYLDSGRRENRSYGCCKKREPSVQSNAPILQLQQPPPSTLPRKPNHTAKLKQLVKHFFAAGFDGVSLDVLMRWLARQRKTPVDLAKRAVVHRALRWLSEHDTILAYHDDCVHNRMSALL